MKSPPRTIRKTRRRGLFLIIPRLLGKTGLLPLFPAAAEDPDVLEALVVKTLGQGQARLAIPALAVDDEGRLFRHPLDQDGHERLDLVYRPAPRPPPRAPPTEVH